MKTLYSNIVSLLLVFSFVLSFSACSSDGGNPVGPDPDPTPVVTGLALYTNFADGYGGTFTTEAENLGAILNGTKVYQVKEVLSDGSLRKTTGQASFTFDDNTIMEVNNRDQGFEVVGKNVAQGKVTIGYNGRKITLNAYTNYNVEGEWKVFKSVDSTQWYYSYNEKFYQQPNINAFGWEVEDRDFYFDSPVSRKFKFITGNTTGELFENQKTMTMYSTSAGLYYRYDRI